VAAAGILVAVLDVARPEALLTGAYLLLGWSVLAAIQPLVAAVSTTGLVLLLAGGLLYSLGTIFHHWRSLPFQNPIWHGFVVAAAACHYVAIYREVATA
jgi:hemolysin III